MSDGDDGAPGADGADGIDGIDGTNGTDGTDGVDATADPALYADLESCNVCHGVVGDMHQAEYNKYAGAVANSVFDLEILSVTSAPIAGGYAGTMTVHIDMDGVPYTGALGDLAQARFYTVQYDSTATDGVYFTNSTSFSCVNDCSIGGGDFELTTSTTSVPTVDPLPEVGMAYGYVADGLLDTEGMRLYENVSNDTLLFGAIDYDSPANVEGCETCHGSPYLKHGYRAAALADTGVADFAACKACHYDDREGGHGEWQWMVDDPYAWATGALDKAEVKAAYPYTANVMNDVHMSHAMEFPYPQSMANCVTCHAGKLDRATA
ncbi:MAG: hypothetical protein OEM03_11480, partial [Chromatiales bacterium]|nr:hypothetical protein [Chromatiales bacterium]